MSDDKRKDPISPKLRYPVERESEIEALGDKYIVHFGLINEATLPILRKTNCLPIDYNVYEEREKHTSVFPDLHEDRVRLLSVLMVEGNELSGNDIKELLIVFDADELHCSTDMLDGVMLSAEDFDTIISFMEQMTEGKKLRYPVEREPEIEALANEYLVHLGLINDATLEIIRKAKFLPISYKVEEAREKHPCCLSEFNEEKVLSILMVEGVELSRQHIKELLIIFNADTVIINVDLIDKTLPESVFDTIVSFIEHMYRVIKQKHEKRRH